MVVLSFCQGLLKLIMHGVLATPSFFHERNVSGIHGKCVTSSFYHVPEGVSDPGKKEASAFFHVYNASGIHGKYVASQICHVMAAFFLPGKFAASPFYHASGLRDVTKEPSPCHVPLIYAILLMIRSNCICHYLGVRKNARLYKRT